MDSASVPGPSVSKPLKIRSGLTRDEKIAIAFGFGIIVILLIAYAYGVNTLLKPTTDQINSAMPW